MARITANEMVALADTGAYGCHAVTVTGNTGQKPCFVRR